MWALHDARAEAHGGRRDLQAPLVAGMADRAPWLPAMVCANCGEEYLDSETSEQVLRMADEAAASGVQVDIRAFRAA